MLITVALRFVGFIPDNAPDPAIIAEPLGSILAQLSTGGGAKGVNIETVRQAQQLWTFYCAMKRYLPGIMMRKVCQATHGYEAVIIIAVMSLHADILSHFNTTHAHQLRRNTTWFQLI